MRRAVPVPEVGRVEPRRDQAVDLLRRLAAGIGAVGGQGEAPRRPEAGDEPLVGRHHGEDVPERAVDGAIEEQLVDLGHPGLHGHHPLVGEPAPDQAVELPGEQQAGRSLFQGLHQVDHDQVEALGGLLEIGAGVLVQQAGARVVKGAAVHLGQVDLALRHHLVVDVHHEAVGDGRVAEDFPDRGSLPAADDHGAAGVGMGQEPGLDQDLVVDELVGLARLDPPVQDQDLPVGMRLHDLHELELGLAGGDGAGDGVHVAFDGRGGLEEPLVLQGPGHQLTATGLCGIGALACRKIPLWTSTTDARSAPSCSMR